MKLVEGVLDFVTAEGNHVDGVSGIYRVSQNTICVELYANKIVDGKVQKVVVMRDTWDRAYCSTIYDRPHLRIDRRPAQRTQ
jgi:hypothetical protein